MLSSKHLLGFILIFSTIFLSAYHPHANGTLTIVSTTPSPRTLNAPTNTAVSIHFDQPIDPSTITTNTVHIFGRWSGPTEGTFAFANLNSTLIFTPTHPFSAGEQVMVVLSEEVATPTNISLPASYTLHFWTQAAVASLNFNAIDTLDVRTIPSQPTQAYGGVATDFNNDGWLDLSIINEITADVRVFLNEADGTGNFHDFIQPTTAVNDRASPNEPADFNNDGNADIAIANIDADSVSILLGNGDGTFAPQQEVAVGDGPRGLTVLDADNDGDLDIVNTNAHGSGNLSLLLNNGNGIFSTPTFFEGGDDAEWALTAADMNEDGLLDLVVGTRSATPTILIHTNNGDATFTLAHTQDNANGRVWMLNAGDVNGDGHEDIVTANSDNATGSVLLGTGTGTLSAPTLYNTDTFPLATDLGDIDGDGDLDWIISSYAGDWNLFINDGAGVFTLARSFTPSQAASCALMLDFDNNGSLDLALIDEVADEVQLISNPPIAAPQPLLAVSPTTISSTLPTNTSITHTLTITNQGTAALNWGIYETACDATVDVPWLHATPATGTTPIATSTPISLILNTTALTPTSYNATLCLASDDPLNSAVPITINLTVKAKAKQWWLHLPFMQISDQP